MMTMDTAMPDNTTSVVPDTNGVVPDTNGVVPEVKKRRQGRPKLEVTANRHVAFRVTEAEERLLKELLVKLGHQDARQFFLTKLVEVAEVMAPEHHALVRQVKKRTLPPWELCPKCKDIGTSSMGARKIPAFHCPSCGNTWMVVDRERPTAEFLRNKFASKP